MAEMMTPPQENNEIQPPQRPEARDLKKVKRAKSLRLFALGLIGTALLSVGYWAMFLKGVEETEDAYVQGNLVNISAQVAGAVKQINVSNMDYVKQGDVLLELNDTDRLLAFHQAENQLAGAVRKERNLVYSVKQLQAAQSKNDIAVKQTKADYERQLKLAKTHSTTDILLSHSKDAYEAALASREMTANQLKATEALVLDTPIREQPAVKSAISALRNAWLNLQRTKILSPVNGYVAKRNVQVGETVGVGRPLMAVVPDDQMWIDANFKETQIKDMRLGQPVKITVDLYGDDVVFDGKISGIDMGTGGAFSLLPAQNATGNWIKIVQRLPVRIDLVPEQIKQYPLRLGLSSMVKVDVSNTEGDTLKAPSLLKAVYSTEVLSFDETEINQHIENIINANMSED